MEPTSLLNLTVIDKSFQTDIRLNITEGRASNRRSIVIPAFWSYQLMKYLQTAAFLLLASPQQCYKPYAMKTVFLGLLLVTLVLFLLSSVAALYQLSTSYRFLLKWPSSSLLLQRTTVVQHGKVGHWAGWDPLWKHLNNVKDIHGQYKSWMYPLWHHLPVSEVKKRAKHFSIATLVFWEWTPNANWTRLYD